MTVTLVTPHIFQSQSSLSLFTCGHLRKTKMAPLLRLNAVAFISPHNHPILIRTFEKGDELKYHYVAHTSLDVIEERTNGPTKSNDCYLGLLYAMDDIAAYGYITPLKMKIVLALPLTDSVVRDAEVIMTFRALHLAYYHASSNPFIRLHDTPAGVGSAKWKRFRRKVDEISRAVGGGSVPS